MSNTITMLDLCDRVGSDLVDRWWQDARVQAAVDQAGEAGRSARGVAAVVAEVINRLQSESE